MTLAGVTSTAVALAQASQPAQILVRVGQRDISAEQLQRAIRSSPVAIQFNTLEEDDQAMIRGRMLKNLIYSEMLYQQALAEHIDQRKEVVEEVEDFRRNLLYQRYLLGLREQIPAPVEDALLKERLKGEPDILAAARAADASGRFGALKTRRLLQLGQQEGLRTDRKPLAPGQRDPQAIVAQGEHIVIQLGDLAYAGEDLNTVEQDELLRRLDKRVEQRLMSQAAEGQGIDVGAQAAKFRDQLIREILMKEKEAAWIPNRGVLRDYYQQHPELSRVVPQWHVGQIVVADRAQAEALRQRIIAGESLFELAAEHSIDPYGRQNAGDMGWVRPDKAPEVIREAVADLPDGTISPVIETPLGFHLVLVQARKPGSQKSLAAVAGGIRRSLILERLAQDYEQLSRQYPITWRMSEHQAATGPAAN